MDKSNPHPTFFLGKVNWRHGVLLLLMLASLATLLSLETINQSTAYHAFADTRMFMGIPNFFDVLSNLPFLFMGALGLRFCLGAELGSVRQAWIVLFVGISLVSFGSAYYHWHPTNNTLVWDRLPMTIGFMGLFVALLSEYVNEQLGKRLLLPAILIGFASVVYWHFTDDLRFYIWVQFFPLLAIPVMMLLFRNGYSHNWLLMAALGWYGLAKVTELYDAAIFDATGGFASGHSIKHILAAVGCYNILLMLRKRQLIINQRG